MKEPLAFRMKPTTLDEVLGQEHIIGKNKFLTKMLENETICSIVFYGPPGSGKTTIATIIANQLKKPYRLLNAVINNKKDLEAAIYEAKVYGNIILIIDEVHRLNKDKQDILLPYVESGLVTLIGATTANPYIAINSAIRSRCHLVEIKQISEKDIVTALNRALVSEKGLNNKYKASQAVLEKIARYSGGDLRFALNKLEIATFSSENEEINLETIDEVCHKASTTLDKDETGHYDAVSALQKSIRGSDVDAAIYYLARLIAYGDLESIERRLLVTAYEDVGLANPQAVDRTINALNAARQVGFPEAVIPLGFAVCDLAMSPKSKSSCEAIHNAINLVNERNFSIPEYLRMTPVGLKDEEKYDYDNPKIWEHIQYLPSVIRDMKFYEPNYESGPYELSLIKNYERLQKHFRSADMKELRKKFR